MSDDLVERLRREGGAVPRSGLARLWKTGRAAAKAGASVLGGSFRGRGDGLAAADLEDIEKLVLSLGELKGIAMKAGQILGYIDPTLSDALRSRLALLQTQSSATPFDAVARTLHEAFGAEGARPGGPQLGDAALPILRVRTAKRRRVGGAPMGRHEQLEAQPDDLRVHHSFRLGLSLNEADRLGSARGTIRTRSLHHSPGR